MALRNILEDGDPILRKTCREVDQVTERTQMILDGRDHASGTGRGTGSTSGRHREKDVRGRAAARGALLFCQSADRL